MDSPKIHPARRTEIPLERGLCAPSGPGRAAALLRRDCGGGPVAFRRTGQPVSRRTPTNCPLPPEVLFSVIIWPIRAGIGRASTRSK